MSKFTACHHHFLTDLMLASRTGEEVMPLQSYFKLKALIKGVLLEEPFSEELLTLYRYDFLEGKRKDFHRDLKAKEDKLGVMRYYKVVV